MIEIEVFPGRQHQLSQIKRFNNLRFPVMLYRTDLLLHSRRVYYLVSEVLRAITDLVFDRQMALALALVHDDAELITGDVTLFEKDRAEQSDLDAKKEKERHAIKTLADRATGPVMGFQYKVLLQHALEKDCPEARLVSYLDKIDGYCECIHEILAGNYSFFGPAHDYYMRISKMPHITEDHLLLQNPTEPLKSDIPRRVAPHRTESLEVKTRFPHYEVWKEVTALRLGTAALLSIREDASRMMQPSEAGRLDAIVMQRYAI